MRPIARAPEAGLTVTGTATVVAGGSGTVGGRSTAISGAASAAGSSTGAGTDVAAARPRRPAGTAPTDPVAEVIKVRPRSPCLTLIRPADDQLASRRRTFLSLQPQSRASATALVSVFPFAAIQASASSSERARIGTTFVSDTAVATAIELVPGLLLPTHGRSGSCT